MKRLLLAAAMLLIALALPASVLAQMTPVTATSINTAGAPIAHGTLEVSAVDGLGNPIALVAGGTLYGPQPFTGTIVGGALTSPVSVPDQCIAVPVKANVRVYYTITIRNTDTKDSFRLERVEGVCGTAAWALEAYQPTQESVVGTTGLVKFTTLPPRCTGTSFGYMIGTHKGYVCDGTTYAELAGTSGGSSALPVTTIAASGASQTITMDASGVYDITLSANCAINFTAASTTGTMQRVTIIIRPNGFQATVPATGILWRGGVAPVASQSAVTVITLGSTGVGPILGDI